MAFVLKSTAFTNDGIIPPQYTCDGKDLSPPLEWEHPPKDTKSFVLIMDDPDAPMGTWDHWLLFNIPATTHNLAENIQRLPETTLTGKNSWGHADYGGPCPPDKEHHYVFKLYALNTLLDLKEGVSKGKLEKAMKGHVEGVAELIGRYNRPQNAR